MGLNLFVGIMLDLEENPYYSDPAEVRASHEEQFERVNAALAAAGLPPHVEPVAARDGLPWGCQMYSYSGLHYLRRFAVYVAEGRGLPEVSSDSERVESDPVLTQYYADSEQVEPVPDFPHLMCTATAQDSTCRSPSAMCS